MTNYLHARLTFDSTQWITRQYGRVTKGSLRFALKDKPGLEFATIATPDQPREGARVRVEEAHRQGVDVIEVHDIDGHHLAMVTIHPSGGAVVS